MGQDNLCVIRLLVFQNKTKIKKTKKTTIFFIICLQNQNEKTDHDSFYQFSILCLNEKWNKQITSVSRLRDFRDCDAGLLHHIRTEPGLIQVRDQTRTRAGPDRDQIGTRVDSEL
ncbi:hypothetical protein NL108_015199 [Boleophthalmus pectinirostris]|nr:hypothetical protein NL108_015199 [Boleophthalmus pectinirostris]